MEVVRETTMEDVAGSPEVVRAATTILTTHVYVIVVAKLDIIRPTIARMLKNL